MSLQAHLPNIAKQDTTYDVDQAIELRKEVQNNREEVCTQVEKGRDSQIQPRLIGFSVKCKIKSEDEPSHTERKKKQS